ncbi:MAG: methionyl-tRNA formyltransferase [Candidatus Gracilibacteria bacterium]|jgi:methionyl-tRNA formyltransferase|nr:methionyl-tRNA formyltransferase [Candidatus Gracilibacteria bacterium]
MKIAFFGSPQIAVKTLENLNKSEEIQLVITQTDKPGKRGKITQTPIKTKAKELKLKVFETQNKTNIISELKKHKIDLNVVFAFGMILEKEVLNYPKYGSINIHASLLPKYRGASPIKECILNGDKKTGITIIQMDEKMDHGEILAQFEINTDEKETSSSLSEKISNISAKNLPEIIRKIENNSIKKQKQDHNKATFCKKFFEKDAEIQENETTTQVIRKINAFDENPIAFKKDDHGKKILIHKAEKSEIKISAGKYKIIEKNLHLGTLDCSIIIKELTYEGKKRMDTKSFLNGSRSLFQ